MISTPMVSVVVPAYNAQEFVGRSLATVVAQHHETLEIIVVDDGSTDGTADVVEEIAARDGRVKLVRQANAGVCAARNVGLASASGRYVMFLDADDLLFPWTVRQLVAEHSRSTVFTFGRVVPITEDDVVPAPVPIVWKHDDSLEVWLRGNRAKCGSGALVVTEVARRVGGFDESLHEAEGAICGDWLFYLALRSEGPSGYRPIPTVGYRRRDDSMSADRAESLQAISVMYERVRRGLDGFEDLDVQEAMSRHFAYHASAALATRQFGEAVDVLRMASSRKVPEVLVEMAVSKNSMVNWRRLLRSVTKDPDPRFPMSFEEYSAMVELDGQLQHAAGDSA